MIPNAIIFPLASGHMTWHDHPEAIRDLHQWLANSPLERSGATSDMYRPIRAFAVHTRSCMGAQVVPAMPNTRSAIAGFGALSPEFASGSGIAAQPRTPCATPARFIQTRTLTQKSRPHAGAARPANPTSAAAGSDLPATAEILPSAAWPFPRSVRRGQPVPNRPHPTNLGRPSIAVAAVGPARTDAAAQSVLPRRATAAVGDAIAAHRATDAPALPAGQGPTRHADDRPHLNVTYAEVAPAPFGSPYETHPLPASSLTRCSESFGDDP